MSKKENSIYNLSSSTANPVWVLFDKKNKIKKDRDQTENDCNKLKICLLKIIFQITKIDFKIDQAFVVHLMAKKKRVFWIDF